MIPFTEIYERLRAEGRHLQEQRTAAKKSDVARKNWWIAETILGKNETVEFSYRKMSRQELPVELRDWPYYGWENLQFIDIAIAKTKKGGLRISLSDFFVSYSVVLRQREDLDPIVLKGIPSIFNGLPQLFGLSDPLKFAETLTRIIDLHRERGIPIPR